MIYLQLFWEFLKVGLFSFGGAYSAIPLIRDAVLTNNWLDEETFSYFLAVSESTPGPIMVNLATYVGTEQAGALGGIVATLASILPAFIIIIIVTRLMEKFIKNKYVQAVISCITPCVVGIILSVGAVMVIDNLFPEFKCFDFQGLVITVILFLCMLLYKKLFKKSLSPILLIVVSAVSGMILYSF